MNDRLKKILITKILENIPYNIKPVSYLADTLDLGRESIYRRLNGQIEFTLAEIVKLSTMLNFSLDEIHSDYDNQLVSFRFNNDRLSTPEKRFQNMLQVRYENIMKAVEAKENHVYMAVNKLIGIPSLRFPHLLKFTYYKWLHQFGQTSLHNYYNELVIPPEITSLAKKMVYYEGKLNKTVILDEQAYHNTIKEIKYYKDRGLINDHDISLIKENLQELYEDIQPILQSGKSLAGTNWEVYLPSLSICSNSSYLKFDENELTLFWIHADTPIYTSDSKMCQMQKDWLDSLKRFSTLISQSNQKMQADFLNQQYKYLEEL